MTESSLKGRLLVANPALREPNFERTVVLLIEHQDEGALGLVLNRPSQTPVAGPLPQWERFAATPGVLFGGGPVGEGAAICLARVTPGAEPVAWRPLVAGLGTLDLESDPDALLGELDELRIFSGYAGWGPGQLEAEIEAGGWFVVDAEPDDALSTDPRQLWKLVLRRQGGRLAIVANFPPHPSMN